MDVLTRYRVSKVMTNYYVLVLGWILILKMKTPEKLSVYDPHAILFLYYLGIYVYFKEYMPNLYQI